MTHINHKIHGSDLNSLPDYGNKTHLKTINDILKIFSLKKSNILTEKETNNFLQEHLFNSFSMMDGGLGKKIETSKEIIDLKNKSIQYIIEYAESFGISLPKELHEVIEISLHEGSKDLVWGVATGHTIKMNNEIFSQLSYERKLHNIIHEILHIIATNHNKMFYNYNYNKNEDKVEVIDIIRYEKQTGYTNSFLGGGFIDKKLGEGLNEGFTDMITFHIMQRNGLNTFESHKSFYMNYIYVIDNIIKKIAHQRNISYHKVLEFLIQGNLLGEVKYLKIIQEDFGKDFSKELFNLGFTEGTKNRDRLHQLEEKILNFIQNHKNLFHTKSLSEEMQQVIGHSDFDIGKSLGMMI